MNLSKAEFPSNVDQSLILDYWINTLMWIIPTIHFPFLSQPQTGMRRGHAEGPALVFWWASSLYSFCDLMDAWICSFSCGGERGGAADSSAVTFGGGEGEGGRGALGRVEH